MPSFLATLFSKILFSFHHAEEFEPVTLSGFVVMLLGKEPEVGDIVEFENLTIKVA